VAAVVVILDAPVALVTAGATGAGAEVVKLALAGAQAEPAELVA